MKRLAAIVAAGAALAAVVMPVAALGQSGGQLKLTESPTSGFPDRAYLLTLPKTQPLSTAQLSVTENDGPVVGLGVQPPGGSSSGAVLLIDASNSMEGAPIEGALAAARAFLAERKNDLPVSVVVFGPDDNVLASFTTDGEDLTSAVAQAPPLAEGTHIYDALINVAEQAKDEGLERTTVVLLSDGTDVGSSADRASALAAIGGRARRTKDTFFALDRIPSRAACSPPAERHHRPRVSPGSYCWAGRHAARAHSTRARHAWAYAHCYCPRCCRTRASSLGAQ